MTVFEIINTLLFKNKKNYEELNLENLNNFQPFMINRWLSFYGKEQAVFVNEIFNKLSTVFTEKTEGYRFYFNITPQQKYKHIQYVKKKKRDTSESEENFLIRAASHANISQREVKSYIDFCEQFCK